MHGINIRVVWYFHNETLDCGKLIWFSYKLDKSATFSKVQKHFEWNSIDLCFSLKSCDIHGSDVKFVAFNDFCFEILNVVCPEAQNQGVRTHIEQNWRK